MTRATGARRISPRMAIALTLVLGTAIGATALIELPVRDPAILPESPSLESALHPQAAASVGSIENRGTRPSAGPAPGRAGMQVALDPETGELGMPTAAERQRLSPDLERDLSYSDEGLRVEYRADGSRHVNLQGRFQNYSVARLQEDGSVDLQCVQGESEAHRLLHECSSPAGSPLPEE